MPPSKWKYYSADKKHCVEAPLEPKRDLFQELQIIPKVELELAGVPDKPSPGDPVCTTSDTKFDLTDATRIPSQQLRSKIKRLTLPGYPPIAVAVRAEGKVVFEVVVSKTGELICANVVRTSVTYCEHIARSQAVGI